MTIPQLKERFSEQQNSEEDFWLTLLAGSFLVTSCSKKGHDHVKYHIYAQQTEHCLSSFISNIWVVDILSHLRKNIH